MYTTVSALETLLLDYQEKALLVKMFEEITFGAVRMLILFFWAMIASIVVLGWISYKRRRGE